MAKITLKSGDEFAKRLMSVSKDIDRIIKEAVYDGADIVADAIKTEIKALPDDEYRKLKPGEMFHGVTDEQRQAISDGFGLSKMEKDGSGWNTKAGFAGYVPNSKTRKYQKGLPVPLLVRSIESGSSVRIKIPFIRRAVTASQRKAKEKMKQVVENKIKEKMN